MPVGIEKKEKAKLKRGIIRQRRSEAAKKMGY